MSAERTPDAPALEQPPLLELTTARIALPSGARIPELSMSARGRRLALIGDWSPLFRLFTGEAALAGGQAEVLGVHVSACVQSGVMGLMLQDPKLPRSWTAVRYLIESGRLLGLSKANAIEAAHGLLARFELVHLTKRAIGTLPLVERRALLVAHASLAEPRVICAQGPLDRLEEDAASYLSARLDLAIQHRSAILHFPSPAPLGRERALIDQADQTFTFNLGEVRESRNSNPAARRGRLLVTVTRHAQAFSAELSRQGLQVSPAGNFPALLPALATREGAELTRFLVAIPDSLDTRPILEAARLTGAPLVEMRPLDPFS